jgi:GNAT superfamily N-acetyltransferase
MDPRYRTLTHRAARPVRVRIERAGWSAYASLARYHYRAGAPATCVLVLAARLRGEHAGVLVVSMPTLNGAWRRAWGDRYIGRDAPGKRRAARDLNAEVRTISRVIVHPRYRALGVATSLVRAYLRRPLTPRTETLAAMGRFCPFFERAGMRPVPLPAQPRHTRLRRALRACAVPLEQLADRDRAACLTRDPRVRAALRTWAGASRGTRSLARRGRWVHLACLAAGALIARPIAYIHERKAACQSGKHPRRPTNSANGSRAN